MKKLLLAILGLGFTVLLLFIAKALLTAEDSLEFAKVGLLGTQAEAAFQQKEHALLLIQDQRIAVKAEKEEGAKAKMRMEVDRSYLLCMGPECKVIESMKTPDAIAFVLSHNTTLIQDLQHELVAIEARAPHQSFFSDGSYSNAKNRLTNDLDRLIQMNYDIQAELKK
jgi:hypothetical protein